MGYDVYCTVNTVASTARSRSKQDIVSVRRLQLDLDENGREGAGAAPERRERRQNADARDRDPEFPRAVPGAVEHGTRDVDAGRGGANHDARRGTVYGGDFTVADVARVMRVPGFRNQKDGREVWQVTWARYGGGDVAPAQFAWLPKVERQATPGPEREVKGQGVSQSERDWAWVRSELRRGSDPEELRRELERRRGDKPAPVYYAQRTVDRAVDSLAAERRARSGGAGVPVVPAR